MDAFDCEKQHPLLLGRGVGTCEARCVRETGRGAGFSLGAATRDHCSSENKDESLSESEKEDGVWSERGGDVGKEEGWR